MRFARFIRAAALAAALLAGCAPSPAAGPAPAPAADTATRWMLRPVPTTRAFRQALENGTRSPTGAPGPRYWQQAVRYRIRAELDPRTTELRGSARIVYHNRSPQALRTMVLNLYQNLFTESAPRNRVAPNTGGVTLERLVVQGVALERHPTTRIRVAAPADTAPVGYAVQETLARLVLPRAVAPGDSVVLEVDWRHKVPPKGAFRTGWEEALGGRAFVVAQWYPQVAVFDDVNGWDATPYLGDGEFYLEYADFDVSLTLPDEWLVGATGMLHSPDHVLEGEALRRLGMLRGADTTVHVVSAADRAAGGVTKAGPDGKVTWRFTAEGVRDFAFAASDRYVWDAARALVPNPEGGQAGVVVHALYRPGAPGWEEAARYGRHATRFFSRQLIPYPWPQVTIAEGPIGGMEYPMLVFIGRPEKAQDLYAVIAHEVAHQWFPMLVGQNEAAYAWMDEGLATFVEDDARQDFYPGMQAHRETAEAYFRVAGGDTEVPLMRHTDLVTPYGARTVAAYGKPATLMVALRAVLGEEVFNAALRTYAREWLLKHPTPWDFFHTVERVAGRDLDWFFYPWWFETGVLDQAVSRVEPLQGGVRVTVRDLGDLPMPAVVVATTAEGLTSEIEVPVESWTEDRLRTVTLTLPAAGGVTRVEIDPRHLFPDVDRTNNVWTAGNAQQASVAGVAP
jgi:Peptidase family M1 domain